MAAIELKFLDCRSLVLEGSLGVHTLEGICCLFVHLSNLVVHYRFITIK